MLSIHKKCIYMQAFFILVFLFFIKDQTRNIIRNLTPYSLHYSKSDVIFILVFFTTVENRLKNQIKLHY